VTVIDHPQATKPTEIPVRLIFGAHDIDELDVFDSEVLSDTCERVSIGGAGPLFGRYLRVETNDLVDVAQALHRLADRIMDTTFDAREEKLEAERHDCYCGTRLEADEVTCGATLCDRKARVEVWADSHSERF
jgi:hypothetical protein